MRAQAGEMASIAVHLRERQAEPGERLAEIEMIDGTEREQAVEVWHHPMVLNVCQPADVDDKLGTSESSGQFVAGLFHIAEGETQSFSRLP
jgi:hypothetical protein